GVSLPDTPITIVHRKPGSGTTLVFLKFLKGASVSCPLPGAYSAAWANNGIEVPDSNEMAATVKQQGNTIGYVEYSYAFLNDLPYASVLTDPDHVPIHADSQNVRNTLPADVPDVALDLACSVLNSSSNRDGYPISALTWLIVPHHPRNQPQV